MVEISKPQQQQQQQQQEVITMDEDDDDCRITTTTTPHRPHLIVVPVSVLPNWMREFETFCPEMNVVKYHGSLQERQEIRDYLSQFLPKKQSKFQRDNTNDPNGGDGEASTLDVILTPVTYFQKEKSDDRSFLYKFQYDYMVVDEAHMLKNSMSTRYQKLDRVSTWHRLLLTGTPVQNSPQELLNMLCFLMPLFARASAVNGNGHDDDDEEEDANTYSDNVGERMLRHFVDEKIMEQLQSTQNRRNTNSVNANDDKKTTTTTNNNNSTMEQQLQSLAYQKLKVLFAPFVLRRKKADVISQLLPPKERIVEYVELDTQARSMYNSILTHFVQEKQEKHNQNNNNKTGTTPKLTAAIGEHLFTNLRKAAHHPLLLRNRHTLPEEVQHLTKYFHRYGAFQGQGCTHERVAEEIAQMNDFHIHLTALELVEENPLRRPDLERYLLNESDLFSSPKCAKLRQLLPRLVQEGHRILIFSSWTSCLDLLGCLMEHLHLAYLRMDGSFGSKERQALLDQFNTDDSLKVFLLSTKACGLGINLTSADTCIIHDLDFNPFNDLQAEDRCHRIGQTKKVTVYKLVTKDTVDEDIFEMQERKSKMNAAIMESSFSNEEAKKERQAMLQSAMNRLLNCSSSNTTTTTTATTTTNHPTTNESSSSSSSSSTNHDDDNNKNKSLVDATRNGSLDKENNHNHDSSDEVICLI